MTLFKVFDLPVFWPILVMYFLLLTFITMKERLKHMLRHGYLPWTSGKKSYQKVPTNEDTAEVGEARKASKD